MNRQYFEKVFSNRRMQRFFDRYPGNEAKAVAHYQANIQLSEALYPVLSVLEVALRNSLNRELTTMFGTADWYLHLSAKAGLKDLNREITIAQKHITKRGEQISADKIVAELTLGFWTRLLNAEYEKILWKDLRRAFPFIAKKDKTRHNVSSPINQIRNLRNRIQWACLYLNQASFIDSGQYGIWKQPTFTNHPLATLASTPWRNC